MEETTMINVSEEIAKLLSDRCFSNSCSNEQCKLDTFGKEIKALIAKVRQHDLEKVFSTLDSINDDFFNRYVVKNHIRKEWNL